MAKNVTVVTTDDLDGTPGAEAMTFAFGGQAYEIDLGPANRERMQASLQPFIDASRRASQRPPRRAARSRTDLTAVRAWATAQGLRVAERGRVSTDVMSKYEAAH